jgi:hypothetical protein
MKQYLLAVVVIIGLLVAVTLVAAQNGELELGWFAIESGGKTSSSAGELELSGTIGHPEAGTITSENLVLWCGFWGATGKTGSLSSAVYLPLVLNDR